MKFQDRFQIASPLPPCEVKSFRAREIGTGREVLVHLIPRSEVPEGSLRLAEILLRRLLELSPITFGTDIQIGEYDDARYAYVITATSDARQLDWLNEHIRNQVGPAPTIGIDLHQSERASAAPLPHIASEPSSRSGPAIEPAQPEGTIEPAPEIVTKSCAGKFTRIFSNPPLENPADNPLRRAETPLNKSASSDTGEFTKFFNSPLASDDEPRGNAPLQTRDRVSKAETPVSPDTGEFTRVFRSPVAGDSSNPRPAPNETLHSEAGRFTTFFPQVPQHDSAQESQGAFSLRMPAPQFDEQERSLDRVESSSGYGVEPSALGPRRPTEGAATQLFKAPAERQPANEPDVKSGPSEFTRVIAMPRASEEATPARPEAPQPADTTMLPAAAGQSFPVLMPRGPVLAGAPTPAAATPPIQTARTYTPSSCQPPAVRTPSVQGATVAGAGLPSISAGSLDPGSLSAQSAAGAPPIGKSPAAESAAVPHQVIAVPRSLLYLILIMNGIFVAALVVVLYFAFTR